MEPERRKQMLLAVLLVMLVAVGFYELRSGPAGAAPGASNRRTADAGNRARAGITAPDVHLKALQAERPQPDGVNRNLFRFKPKAAPPPPPVSARSAADRNKPDDGPPAATPVAPIALKFLGVMESPERSVKVAWLGDARGVYSGKEGDIIEGRYRIIRIGAESIEMTHLDGTGRQVIRQSGS
jgi:hypothetical protein